MLPPVRQQWFGTTCTLISYDFGRTIARSPAFLGQNSLRNICNALLFDPVLPFLVREERSKYVKKNPKNAQGVIVVGNAARLAELASKQRSPKIRSSEEDEHDDLDEDAREAREVGVVHHETYKATLPTGGTAVVRYWIMGESQKYKKDWRPTRSYVPPEQAVTLTHNGQRHAAWSREFFEGIGYASLGKSIVAQVDADNLDWSEKRQLFATTRDKLKQTNVAQALREKVDTALRQDDWLRGEEKRRRMRALGRESKEQAERIQKMLANAITAFQQSNVDVYRKVWSSNPEFPVFSDQPLVDPQPPWDFPGDVREPVTYTETPSTVHVLNAPLHIPAGGRAVVRLLVDACDGYFEERGGGFFAIVTRGGDFFRVEGYSSLRDGIMRCTVSAKDASPGDRGRVVFTVTRPDALPIADDAELVADEPPRARAKPVGKQPGKDQGPPVKPCHRESWRDYGFDETTVAKLIPELDDPTLYTIYVNWDYPPLDEKLLNEKRLDEEIASSFKERFVAAMGFLVWLQHQAGAAISNEELARAARVHLFSAFVSA
jgi:hypothetical protein